MDQFFRFDLKRDLLMNFYFKKIHSICSGSAISYFWTSFTCNFKINICYGFPWEYYSVRSKRNLVTGMQECNLSWSNCYNCSLYQIQKTAMVWTHAFVHMSVNRLPAEFTHWVPSTTRGGRQAKIKIGR